MFESLMSTLAFAQDAQDAPANQPTGSGLPQIVFMGLIIMLMFYFMLVLPNRRRERERKSMLASLKKNDHVVTVGGIKGVVTNVKVEDDEVVLKIDEATGAKLRVVLSSIARVIAAEEAAGEKKAP